MGMDKGSLVVEGHKYEKQLRVPSCHEILQASVAQHKERLSKDITKGGSKIFKGQEFIGYAMPIKSMEEVNVAYTKVHSIHTDARHIVSACRLSGRNFHTCQDFQDDGEHGGGIFLLNLLLDSNIQNRAIFVVQNYDGTHICNKRFEMMHSVVKSALDRAPVNPITGNDNCVWQEENVSSVSNIRGRGHGRGSRNQRVHANSMNGVTKQQTRAISTMHGMPHTSPPTRVTPECSFAAIPSLRLSPVSTELSAVGGQWQPEHLQTESSPS